MKKYEVQCYVGGDAVLVEVNVPTHKELQGKSIRGDIQVIISNFSYSDRKSFSVAKFELETNEACIKMGCRFQLQAERHNIMSFEGKNARKDAIEWATDMLIGRV